MLATTRPGASYSFDFITNNVMSESSTTVAGMGAVLTDQGTAFRVWAPHAHRVAVVGDFNDWNDQANELNPEENGYWYTLVDSAQAGHEYKFAITSEAGDTLLKNDPYARMLTNSAGNGIITDLSYDWEDDQFETPYWNDVVIYEMHVGTFHVTDPGRPGTFHSVIDKLPYLQELGINAIELMPITEFPGDYSWGYNPAHPFAVEESYGGITGLKDLVKAAHQAGIAVILDVVYNHFGPSDIDLWQFDGWSDNDGGGVYFYNDWRAETPWGATRPDYGRPEVRQYLRDNALMWLEEFRMDGLRLDGTMFMRNANGMDGDTGSDIPEVWDFFQELNLEINERYPRKLIIAEDLMDNAAITQAVDDGGAGFGSQWWGGFVHPVRSIIIESEDQQRNMETLANIVEFSAENAFRRVIYTESHDEVANGKARVNEEIWPGESDNYFALKRSFLGAALVFTAPGIPMMFQGQEFAEDKWFADGDPLDWSLTESHAGVLQMYRDIIRLRRNIDDTTRGLTGAYTQVYHINKDQKMLAFQRWNSGGALDTTVVVINFANETRTGYSVGLPQSGIWRLRFNSDWKGYVEDFTDQTVFDISSQEGETDGMPDHGLIDIGPYSVLIFSKGEE
jgi:1,4-alpha-glucan branching enzyme